MSIGIGINMSLRGWGQASNPIPTTTSLGTASNDLFSGQQTVLVNGTGFVADSKVHADGVEVDTTYVSATQLSATFPNTLQWPKDDTATYGTLAVTVVSPAPGGGESNAQTYTLTYPAGIEDHKRGDLGITPNGSDVAAWADLSGKGHHASHATPALQPTTSTAIAGRACVSADGTNALALAVAYPTGAKEVFTVAKLNALPGASDFDLLLSLKTATPNFSDIYVCDTGISAAPYVARFDYQSAGLAVGIADALDTDAHRLHVAWNGGTNTDPASYAIALDGVAKAEIASTTFSRIGTNKGALFARLTSADGISRAIVADLAEYMVWTSITAGQRTEVGAYLAARYA